MLTQVDTYADNAPNPIMAIADFADIKQFPSFLISMGLRRGDVNPVRNSAFLESSVGEVTRITRINKIAFVRNRQEAQTQIDMFLRKQ